MRYAIPIKDHPVNLDPAAKMTKQIGAIYRVHNGFIACVGDDMRFEGHFATERDAEEAQREYLVG